MPQENPPGDTTRSDSHHLRIINHCEAANLAGLVVPGATRTNEAHAIPVAVLDAEATTSVVPLTIRSDEADPLADELLQESTLHHSSIPGRDHHDP
jgi:hypothetical protein